MSKIQEALRKIQRETTSPLDANVGEGNDAASNSAILARLVVQNAERSNAESDVPSREHRLIQFDQQALRDAGLLAPEYDERLLADQYREIKRPLIANAFGKNTVHAEFGNLIMVSSALAGEGKTFTAINLALSMARERDYSVVLVDADVAKPNISDVLGVANSKGLLDVLENEETSVETVILPTDIDGLKVLPAGKPRQNATELIASSRTKRVMNSLRDGIGGSLVIFDSPPLLQTTESKVLASHMGQIVLIVRAEETPQGAVAMAIETLGEERPVNLILNQARSGSGEQQYGYNYGGI